MRKIKIFLVCSFIFFIIISGFFVRTEFLQTNINKENKDAATHPIDVDTGLINNEYFSISKGNENAAMQNVEGINNALSYAEKNNINYIKLEEGTYYIKGEGERTEKKGIIIPSNITLDLNNSIFMHVTSEVKRYTVFAISNVENVKLCNGIIIGDRNSHIYTNGGTHEWGYGVEIKNSTQVAVENLEIKELTGDGIVVSEKSSNIKIINNNIFDCRRQGVTVTQGDNIEIVNNEIHQIKGTNPQSGIDLESDEAGQINNIKISENKIHTIGKKLSIICSIGINKVNISNNYLQGNALVCDSEEIKLNKNVFKNSSIQVYISKSIWNTNREVKKLYITENEFLNGNINLNSKDKKIITGKVEIKKNKIVNGNISAYSINCLLQDNYIKNSKQNVQDFAYQFLKINEDNQNYKIELKNNVIEGAFKDISIIGEGINVTNE